MPDKNGSKITTQQIYELVDRKINEVNSSIVRLETKFDTLEAGRLSILEKDFANFQGKIAVISGVVSIVISGLFLIINLYFK